MSRKNRKPERLLRVGGGGGGRGSLALGAASIAVVLALGANNPPSKEAKFERMIGIGEQVAELRAAPDTLRTRNTLNRLMREYQSLSESLGGDDPAQLGVVQAGGEHAGQNDGGLASAPAAPPNCVSANAAFSNVTPVAIPTVAVGAPVTSTITVSGVGPFLWDVNATTFLAHVNSPDLDVTLTSPAGTVVTLTTDNGFGSNNFNGTIWDDDANPLGTVATSPNNGVATEHGYVNNVVATTLVAEEALGAFFGEDPNGVWTITLSDDTGGSGGTLASWSLDITTADAAPTISTPAAQANVTPVAISSSGTPTITSSIIVASLETVITDIDLSTFITHTFAEDLEITLTSPATTIVTITTDNGGSNDNVFNGTIWNDGANPSGTVPQTSNNGVASDHVYANNVVATTLVPEEAMAAFIGEDPNGTWTLSVRDDRNTDGGSLNSWALDFDTVASLPTLTTTNFSTTTPASVDQPIVVSSQILVSGAGTYLWDLDAATTIAHTANADLDITLTSPAGTVVTLTTDNGATLDNGFNGTAWDDDANPLGLVPYTANNGVTTDNTYVNNIAAVSLVSEEALAAFIGEDPNGTWTLTIHDDASTTDGGSLNAWSLSVTTLAAAPINDSPVEASNATVQSIATTAPPQVITSTVNITGAPTFLCDIDATLNVTHSACGDLDITLTSPAGTIVTLTTDNGGTNNNNFAGSTFNDDADPDGQVPFVNNSGSVTDHLYVNNVAVTNLTPEEALGAFIGEDPNGDWTLTISDDATGDGGTLNSWSISVVTCACDAPPLPCPADTNDDGFVNVTDLLAVIGAWGTCTSPPCAADINGDNLINVTDLLAVIGAWGNCPP